MKACSRCKVIKALGQFSRDYSKPSGRQSWCKACKTVDHYEYKELVLSQYGRVCKCCGTEADLSIDHIDGSGAAHRTGLNVNTGLQFYLWLIKNNYPAGYQTLCVSCNASKGQNAACNCGGKGWSQEDLMWLEEMPFIFTGDKTYALRN